MGLRFNPKPTPRFDQSLVPVINENFNRLAILLASITTEHIGATAPENPYPGQLWIDTNTYSVRVWDGSNWNPRYIGFTPTINQSVTLTKTLVYSKYKKEGPEVKIRSHWNITSAGTAGQQIIHTLPFTSLVAGNSSVGSGFYYNGAVNIPVVVYMPTTTTVGFLRCDNGNELGAGTTAANGHALTINFEYEATS